MFPEEQLPGLVSQSDALAGDLEVDHCGGGEGPGEEQLGDGLPDSLGAGQLVCVHAEQVEHVAGGPQLQ